MRNLYLIRHGRPDIPEGEAVCLGSTDLGLGTLGRLQACLLGEGMKQYTVSQVFCSHLSRSGQTARYLCEKPVVLKGLEEQAAGEWDGLSFREIRLRWPELYEQRGTDLALLLPGEESPVTAAGRFEKAVCRALETSRGDIAIVAHKSVIQLFLCRIFGKDFGEKRKYPLPYASVTRIEYDGAFQVKEMGRQLWPPLTEDLCLRLLEAAQVPETVWRHCAAVSREAKRIQKELEEAGCRLDGGRIAAAAWLHDIARTEKEHARKGADWLRELGYERIASIAGQHHELEDPMLLDEAAVVFLADKCVQGDKRVSVEERFVKSREKCRDEEARLAHQRRYEQSLQLKNRVNSLCGKEVIL